MQATKRRIYSDKSYFVYKEKRQGKDKEVVELSSDDKVIKISSKDKADFSLSLSKTVTPKSAVWIDKGKGRIIDDEKEANKLKIKANNENDDNSGKVRDK